MDVIDDGPLTVSVFFFSAVGRLTHWWRELVAGHGDRPSGGTRAIAVAAVQRHTGGLAFHDAVQQRTAWERQVGLHKVF